MTMKCTVCRHPDREAIDRALVMRAETFRGLAKRHGLSKDSLLRHYDDHLPAALLKAKEAEDIASATKLLGEVEGLRVRAIEILDAALAETEPDRRSALSAIREARGCLELYGKLAGQIPEGPTVNIVMSPEWQALQAFILQALDPYPDARLAVADALASPKLESLHAPGHA